MPDFDEGNAYGVDVNFARSFVDLQGRGRNLVREMEAGTKEEADLTAEEKLQLWLVREGSGYTENKTGGKKWIEDQLGASRDKLKVLRAEEATLDGVDDLALNLNQKMVVRVEIMKQNFLRGKRGARLR